ncbi:hypothetical protein KIN20_010071 [Parelaphostrongylus tenuis]|uniref:Uncharacterized protein n=2 Tax=Parelaphostrongylus tenuis TaxID=148309 RepID=A0AAD5M7B8_PARTN|nr:hypothetical protein KIN20_010059 [Parelaphostrongylus tenuis]KAJ1353442.1 hypothetical protein KIN20_010071 [Parelaphostrongylus tenuis]
MQPTFVFYRVITGEKVVHSDLQSMKSTKLKKEAQKENLLLGTDFNALVSGDLELEDRSCSGHSTLLNNEDLMAALDDDRRQVLANWQQLSLMFFTQAC